MDPRLTSWHTRRYGCLRGPDSRPKPTISAATPFLRRSGMSRADQHRASRATVVGGDGINLPRRLPEEAVPNVVYFLHQAPTTSVPLNLLAARGWQVVPNPL